jgi:hypothetical protein
VLPDHNIGFAHVFHRADIPAEIRLPLGRRQLAQQTHVEPRVRIAHEDWKDRTNWWLHDSRRSHIEPGCRPDLAEQRHIVATAGPDTGQLACENVRAAIGQQVAVPQEDAHDEGSLRRSNATAKRHPSAVDVARPVWFMTHEAWTLPRPRIAGGRIDKYARGHDPNASMRWYRALGAAGDSAEGHEGSHRGGGAIRRKR